MGAARPMPSAKAAENPLSKRERQVAAGVARALLNKQIAFELHLTEGTIKEYMGRIFRKLDVHNRTELAVWWISTGQAVQLPDAR